MTDPITPEAIGELERLRTVEQSSEAQRVANPMSDNLAGANCVDYVAWIEALEAAAPALLSAAKRSLEYEAFFREHGPSLAEAIGHQGWRHRHRGGTSETDPSRVPGEALDLLLERLK